MTGKNVMKTREELMTMNKGPVKSAEAGKAYLEKHFYAVAGQEYTTATLSHILMLLAHGAQTAILTEGARAVALILDVNARETERLELTSTIEAYLEAAGEKLDSAIVHLNETAENVRGASTGMDGVMNELRDECQALTNQMNEAADALAGEVASAITALPLAANVTENGLKTNQASAATFTEGQPQYRTTATYAQAHLPAEHTTTLARINIRQKQVLIDKAPGTSTNGLETLTEEELVKKAKTALTMMGLEAGDAPEGTRFRGARKLKNGGIIYEMETAEAAAWLKGNDVMDRFIAKYGGKSIIKNRAFTVVIEYVPVTIDLEENPQDTYHILEKANNLQPLSILNAKWIKPPYRRTRGQRTAHLIMGFKSQDAANQSIKEGLVVAGKRVWARKLIHEPRRCLKCQRIGAGHLAAECSQKHDTCGTCAEDHRTETCKITEKHEFRCINCEKEGHAAWDRMCPDFLAAATKFTARNPENTYKYFPTNDPESWEPVYQPTAHRDKVIERQHSQDHYERERGETRSSRWPFEQNRATERNYGEQERVWTQNRASLEKESARGVGRGYYAGGLRGEGGGAPSTGAGSHWGSEGREEAAENIQREPMRQTTLTGFTARGSGSGTQPPLGPVDEVGESRQEAIDKLRETRRELENIREELSQRKAGIYTNNTDNVTSSNE